MQWPNIHHAAMRKLCVGTASRHPRTLPLGQLDVVDFVGHGSQTNHVEPGMGQRSRRLSAHVLIATGVTPTPAATSPVVRQNKIRGNAALGAYVCRRLLETIVPASHVRKSILPRSQGRYFWRHSIGIPVVRGLSSADRTFSAVSAILPEWVCLRPRAS